METTSLFLFMPKKDWLFHWLISINNYKYVVMNSNSHQSKTFLIIILINNMASAIVVPAITNSILNMSFYLGIDNN